VTTCYNMEERIFFVHIPKCAGTTIGGAYDTTTHRWSGCWLNDAVGGFVRDGLPNGHQPVRTIERWTGKPIDWWDKIIVSIRNPFRQQWSQYQFWRRRGKKSKSRGYRPHDDDVFAMSCDFRSFIASPRSAGPNAMCGDDWQTTGGVYRWWLVDEHNQIPPNVHVVKTEQLASDLQRVLGRDDLPALPVVNAGAGSGLGNYDSEMIALMRRKFAWSLAVHYPTALREAYNTDGAKTPS
jgi:hypothetical protein